MGLLRFNPLARWVIIAAGIVMIANAAVMWKVVKDSMAEARADYAIFQNDLFQHGVFINRTTVTLHRIHHEVGEERTFARLKKKLDAYTRAILGHQRINLQIYAKIIDRLPEDDPLMIRQQILVIRPRVQELVEVMGALNTRIVAAGSSADLVAAVKTQEYRLEDFLRVMNDSVHLHSQIESVFFSVMKAHNLTSTQRLAYSLNLLVFLMALIGVAAGLYLIEQRRNRRQLDQLNADLEIRVRARTQELLAANSRLQSQVIERINKESALLETERELRQAQAIAHLGNWTYDLEKDRFTCSDELYRIFGQDRDDDIILSRERVGRFLVSEDRERYDQLFDRIRKDGSADFELRLQRGDGEERWIWGQGRTIEDPERPSEMLRGIVQDITATKRSVERIEASEAKQRFILDSLPDMVVEVDREMRILWANKSAMAIDPQAIGQTCHGRFSGRNTVCDGCYVERAFHSGRIEMGIMYQPASSKLGESYWENIGVPLKDSAGEVTSVLKVSRNVTERELGRQRELEIQSQRAHTSKMESIGTLAGGVAHNFNNLLSIMIGNAELLTEELPGDAPQQAFVEEIFNAGLRARDVVAQLLTFSVPAEESGNSVIDMAQVLRQTLRLIRSSIPANVNIDVQVVSPVDPVYGNADQLEQVIVNLCTNAKEAVVETSGTIVIGLRNTSLPDGGDDRFPELAPGNYVALTFQDNGVGMAPETLGRIFEPFFTTKAFGKGTGFGLAEVHGIVKGHGGDISVSSEAGKGTTFTILLAAHKRKSASPVPAGGELPRGNEQILLVDDEAAIRKMGKQGLERLGYTVTCAADPKEALDLMRTQRDRFELVITDMAMPHMSGVQLATEILKDHPDLPIILCTGYSESLSEEKARAIGIADLAMKPLDRSELAVRVRRVLDEGGS